MPNSQTCAKRYIEVPASPAMLERIETLRMRGGYRSRAQLVRSLLLAIINDDAKAHDEPPLEEAA